MQSVETPKFQCSEYGGLILSWPGMGRCPPNGASGSLFSIYLTLQQPVPPLSPLCSPALPSSPLLPCPSYSIFTSFASALIFYSGQGPQDISSNSQTLDLTVVTYLKVYFPNFPSPAPHTYIASDGSAASRYTYRCLPQNSHSICKTVVNLISPSC